MNLTLSRKLIRISEIHVEDDRLYYLFGVEDGKPMDITKGTIDCLESYLYEENEYFTDKEREENRLVMETIKTELMQSDIVRVFK